MAITAAITLSSATSTAPGAVTATCTITNANSTAANALEVFPTVVVNGGLTQQSCAVQCGFPALGPGVTTSIPGSSGTLVLNFPVQAFAPFSGEGTANPTSVVYTIGATIRTNASGSDALVVASTTNLTVSAPSSH